jgi:hypothetical protein
MVLNNNPGPDILHIILILKSAGMTSVDYFSPFIKPYSFLAFVNSIGTPSVCENVVNL